VEGYCASVNSAVVGYYCANERRADTELTHLARKVGERIHARVPSALLIVLEASPASTASSSLPLKAFSLSGSVWQQRDPSSVKVDDEAGARAALEACLTAAAQYELCDFDDHLDDGARVWIGQKPAQLSGRSS